jgi:DNA-binding Lrp family transcriptional regulator
VVSLLRSDTGLAGVWWKAKDARGGKRMDNIDMKLLRLLMRGVPMHTTEMARLLSVKEDEVQQRMGHLHDMGLVEYAGPGANA